MIVDSALKAAAHLRSSKIPSEVVKSTAALFSAFGGAKHVLPDLPYDYGALERTYIRLCLCLFFCLLPTNQHPASPCCHSCGCCYMFTDWMGDEPFSTHSNDFFFVLHADVSIIIFFHLHDTAAISAETMTIHHTKHHNTYVTNLNASLEKLDAALSANNVSTLISLQGALKFNGGGHLNHTLFWENLSPKGSSASPGPKLSAAINESFGTFDKLKAELSAKSIAVQGSGWGWLAYNPTTSRLEVATCANQDPLQATTGLVPLMVRWFFKIIYIYFVCLDVFYVPDTDDRRYEI
jgi:superoxide dismutase